MSTPMKFDPNYRAPKGSFFGNLPTSAGTPSPGASSSAQPGQSSNTVSSAANDATETPARIRKPRGKPKALQKAKPKDLPNTWSPPKSYDPEKFGHPLPGPKPAWGLAMPKDTPDVSRAYRTKDYANEEDREADKGTERLVFRSQDQAPYTAMGMPWAQNEQSQARFVMSHHDGNVDVEQKEMMLAYQAARDYIRAQKAEKARKAELTKLAAEIAADDAREDILQMNEDDSAKVQDWYHLALQQVQKSGNDNRPASREPSRARETERTTSRLAQVEDKSSDDELLRRDMENFEAATAAEPAAQIEANNVRPAEPESAPTEPESVQTALDTAQAEPNSAQLSPRGERPVDPAVLVVEQISTDMRNRFGYLMTSIMDFLMSTANWIKDAYRYTSPVLGDAISTFLDYSLRGGLIAIALYTAYWVFQMSMGVLTDSPYSVTQDDRPVATSTKFISTPKTTKVVIGNDPVASFQGPRYSLMSSFGDWVISLVSGLGYVYNSVLGLTAYVFVSVLDVMGYVSNGIGSFFVSLLYLLKAGFNGFTSSCVDLVNSELFTFDLTGLGLILIFLALAALLYYRSSIAEYLKPGTWILESAKSAARHTSAFAIKVLDGALDWITSAWNKVWRWAKTSWAWTKKTVRDIWNGPVQEASGAMLWWLLFLSWSFIMFCAGFGFRDFYDGFQKVTVVASPC